MRDESKMIGGLGICGQPFCCSRFLKDFQPVSIKMAKEQGLSLNPTKHQWCLRPPDVLPGLRGERLRVPEQHHASMVGSTVRTPDGLGTVLEVNPISGYLRVLRHRGLRAPVL
ncbi:MAG: regulatory iron-sulfur-containing complex subunit RicT [Faecalibacterium prausnitzii]